MFTIQYASLTGNSFADEYSTYHIFRLIFKNLKCCYFENETNLHLGKDWLKTYLKQLDWDIPDYKIAFEFGIGKTQEKKT